MSLFACRNDNSTDSVTLCINVGGTRVRNSGVGTVAAVAALAATLFRPKINIHNLL